MDFQAALSDIIATFLEDRPTVSVSFLYDDVESSAGPLEYSAEAFVIATVALVLWLVFYDGQFHGAFS